MIVAEIGQCIDGVPENVRYPDQSNGEAPKNFLAGAVFQEDRVAHRDPLVPLGQRSGPLEGDCVVVDAVLADLGAEAAGHQVQLGPVVSCRGVNLVDDAAGSQLNAVDIAVHLLFGNGLELVQATVLTDDDLLQGLGNGDCLLQLILHLVGVGDGIQLGQSQYPFLVCMLCVFYGCCQKQQPQKEYANGDPESFLPVLPQMVRGTAPPLLLMKRAWVYCSTDLQSVKRKLS